MCIVLLAVISLVRRIHKNNGVHIVLYAGTDTKEMHDIEVLKTLWVHKSADCVSR